jgi:YARHG domain
VSDWKLLGAAIVVVLLVMELSGAGQPGGGECLEDVGCGGAALAGDRLQTKAECSILWGMRNEIYQESGYCFHTARAIAAFGNGDCRYDKVDEVPLSTEERRGIAAISRVEEAKHCRN